MKQNLHFIFFLLLLQPMIVTNGQETSDPQDMDLIFFNGEIVTMAHDNQPYSIMAIKDGLISFLGDLSDEFLEKSDATLIDLEGRTLLPGFIDSHSHWIGRSSVVGRTADQSIALALSHGWTTISELGGDRDLLDKIQELDQDDELKLRVNVFLMLNYAEEIFGDWYQVYEPHQQISDKIRIGGVKLFMDSGPDLGYVGRSYFLTQRQLDPIVKTAHDLGFQIAIHSIADNATDIALNALADAQGDNTAGTYRHRIEHALLLRDDQITRLNDMNTIVSGQLLFSTTHFIDEVESVAGWEDIVDKLIRWKDVIDGNVTFIGVTDHPWGNPPGLVTSLQMLYRAATRIPLDNGTAADYILNQKITVLEALKSITIDAAYGNFEEDVKGSIELGKYADLVALSDNPLTIEAENLPSVNVDMTMVGGQFMYCSDSMKPQCVDGDNDSNGEGNNRLSQWKWTSIAAVIPIILVRRNKIHF